MGEEKNTFVVEKVEFTYNWGNQTNVGWNERRTPTEILKNVCILTVSQSSHRI